MASRPSARSHSSASTMSSGISIPRPQSRQSTTSVQSQAQQDQIFHAQAHPPPTKWQQSAEDAIVQSAHHLQNPDVLNMVDPALHPALHQSHRLYQPTSITYDSADFDSKIQDRIQSPAEFAHGDSSLLMDAPAAEDVAGDGSRRKKGSASSAANDIELRRLFRENEGRDLHEVAQQVAKDEKGPKAEKTKQIFGMLWLNTHCKKSGGSVPRNRVFSHYADRCGTERVPPLNPASFGKLVRIIFPGIQTRRLGIRGESKYHYVELSLVNEDSRYQRQSVQRAPSVSLDSFGEKPTSINSKPPLSADTAFFPPMNNMLLPTYQAPAITSRLSTGSLYLVPQLWSTQNAQLPRTISIRRPLQFPTAKLPAFSGDVQLELPDIGPYLPSGTDVDAVDSLTSVYRSHCLLAIDNFRFCKTEKLCDSYKSLVGLLTVPGQKLLAHPNIAYWVRACDWLKYQKMIPMLDMILLTQVPPKAMAHMEHVANNICAWISQYFQNQPQSIQDAMLGPANIFVSLLERFLRVNRAALDINSVLESIENRDQLWNDWVDHVKPYHVIQNSLLDKGHKRVLHILTQEVRFLLSPLRTGPLLENGTMFENTGVRSSFETNESHFEEASSSSTIIARLARFLGDLPTRFPGVDARSMLNFIDVVGNNISRNLTLNGALSLGNWWRIKLFIDEMSYWLAEKGGFLETGPEMMFARAESFPASFGGSFGLDEGTADFGPSRQSTTASMSIGQQGNGSFEHGSTRGNTFSQRHAQASSVDFFHDTHGNTTSGQLLQQQHAPQQRLSKQGSHPSAEPGNMTTHGEDDGALADLHDDSGIGMGLEEDDFGIGAKYNSFVGGVHGSDPADVVVC